MTIIGDKRMKAGGQTPKPSSRTIPGTDERTDEFGKGLMNSARIKEEVQKATGRKAKVKAKVANPRTLENKREETTAERPKTTPVGYPRLTTDTNHFKNRSKTHSRLTGRYVRDNRAKSKKSGTKGDMQP